MARLIYSMIVSQDGYTQDKQGSFGWGAPEDDAVHGYINELASSVGTYLYGRRMYETMLYWETVDMALDLPAVQRNWAHQWQATEKVVFSRTLTEPRSARTSIERRFDVDAIRERKNNSDRDLTVDGPELAGQAIAAGLVDEYQLIVCPALAGGGTRYWPHGVAGTLRLLEARPFDSGVVALRYGAR